PSTGLIVPQYGPAGNMPAPWSRNGANRFVAGDPVDRVKMLYSIDVDRFLRIESVKNRCSGHYLGAGSDRDTPPLPPSLAVGGPARLDYRAFRLG
ncbi:MAG: hypothetical protein ACTSQ7_11360, partial [Alphaproteobacteria bacterium]